MKRITVLAVLGLVAMVVPAHADKSHKCLPHAGGYNARGVLVSSALTSDGGNRYSGTLEVNVTKANHHATTGDQTFTLTGAKVKFHHGVDPTTPAPGSSVKLHGKITSLSKHCPAGSFTPTINVNKVDIK